MDLVLQFCVLLGQLTIAAVVICFCLIVLAVCSVIIYVVGRIVYEELLHG